MIVLKDTLWLDDAKSALVIIDQTLLPNEEYFAELTTTDEIADAIKRLRVRGAPAIGVAAACGAYLAAKKALREGADFYPAVRGDIAILAASRPTAHNLFWALERMEKALASSDSPAASVAAMKAEAERIIDEDIASCTAIGEYGAPLFTDGMRVLTHCNAGRLAAVRYGTALAPIYRAAEKGVRLKVYADETRPLLQGARLTAWELHENGIDVTLICDNMAATVMRQGKIDAVFVGADRIAANGDTANKIGTYSVALVAKAHGVPFYVVAPRSTFDLTLENGDGIPIEERDPNEIVRGFGRQTVPDGIDVYNPAFDVTPAELIAGIVTENGVISPVTRELVAKVVGQNKSAPGVPGVLGSAPDDLS